MPRTPTSIIPRKPPTGANGIRTPGSKSQLRTLARKWPRNRRYLTVAATRAPSKRRPASITSLSAPVGGWRGKQLADLVVSDLMKVGVDLPDGIERGRHRRAHHVIGFS